MFNHYVYKKGSVRAAIWAYDTFGQLFWRRKSPQVSNPPQHIVLIILHQIGDMVMCLPSIEAIRTMFPVTQLTVMANSTAATLLEKNPWQAKVVTFNPAWQKVVVQFEGKPTSMTQSKEKFLEILRHSKPDVALAFHPDLVVNQLLGQTSIPRTIGFMNAGAGFCLTNPSTMPPSGHQVERNYALVKMLASLFSRTLPTIKPPHLSPDAELPNEIQKSLGKKYIVLHPYASAPTKNWLEDRWYDLITWIQNQGYTAVVIGGKDDAIKAPDKTVILSGILNFPQTATLLKRAALFVGVDSGPGHVAAAVGCPVITIFSSVNDPQRWAPYGDKNHTLILHHPVKDRRRFPYELRNVPAGVTGNPYSDGISTQDVIAAIEKLQ